MAANKLEKQIATALKSTERWMRKQPSWPEGNLRGATGSAVSPRGPAILSQADCVLQFARHLNDAGVSWKDIHISISPAQWLVNPARLGAKPPMIDLAVADRDKLAKRTEPFSPGKKKDFLFDAVFEFRLASNSWDRPLPRGKQAKPPARVATGVRADIAKVKTYLDSMLARRGYVVVIEEADHDWDRGDGKDVDGLSIHYLKCF